MLPSMLPKIPCGESGAPAYGVLSSVFAVGLIVFIITFIGVSGAKLLLLGLSRMEGVN